MSAIEFAKRYAGTQFIIPADLIPQEAQVYDGFRYYAHLVGYLNDTTVVVELHESSIRNKCWPLYDGVTLVVHHNDLYEKNHPMVLAINYKLLKEPENIYERFERNKRKQVVPPPPKTYPVCCKICKAPARIGRVVMCSNKSCPSRARLLRMLDIKPVPKGRVILCPHRVADGTCGKKAVGFFREKTRNFHGLYCEAGHRFSVLNDLLNVNDIVLLTLGGNDRTDRIWDGTKWEIR